MTALMTSVFCTSTRTATDASTSASASTASTEWKNVAPAPPCASGTSIAHDAEAEQLLHQGRHERGLLVHRSDVRRDLGARELQDAVAEEALVVREVASTGWRKRR